MGAELEGIRTGRSGHRIGTGLAVVALAALTLQLSGCFTFNHYYLSKHQADFSGAPGGKLEKEIAFAESVQRDFQNGATEQNVIQKVAILTLVPLSATALGLGINGTGGDTLMILGLSGATVWSLGNIFSSSNQIAVFQSGAEAVDCALNLVKPYWRSDAEVQELDTLLGTGDGSIPSLMADVAEHRGAVQAAFASLSAPPGAKVISRVDNALADADSSLQEAAKAYQGGNNFREQRYAAARDLETGISGIRNAVAKGLKQSDVDLAGLRGSLGSLAAGFDTFMKQGPLPSGTGGAQGAAGRGGTGSLSMLITTTGPLEESIVKLRAAVTRLAALSDVKLVPSGSIDSCKDQIDQAQVGLRLSPTEAFTFKEKEAATASLIVSGGRPNYFAKLLSAQTGISVKIEWNGATALLVTQVSADVPADEYLISLSDTAGHVRTVPVRVGTVSSTSTTAGGVPEPSNPPVAPAPPPPPGGGDPAAPKP